MIMLTEVQVEALLAFHDAFALRAAGIWSVIEQEMQEAGIDDPDARLEDALQALREGC